MMLLYMPEKDAKLYTNRLLVNGIIEFEITVVMSFTRATNYVIIINYTMQKIRTNRQYSIWFNAREGKVTKVVM
jgi:hypothetical protein